MPKTFVLQNDHTSKLKVDYQADLNPEQLEVVFQAEGPCLVLAGAGSGKTRTIVYRVAYLIEQGIKPENILLLTFTNKAAREMLQRTESLLGRYPEGLWGGTFHHVGNRILRRYGPLLGYQANFTILDEEDSKDLIKVAMKDEGIEVKQKMFPSPAVIKDILSFAKNSRQKLSEVIEIRQPKWRDLEAQIFKIGNRYEQKKKDNNSMDFDDLLACWLKLLKEHPQTKNKLASQFKYILVDEYQDTNYIQAEIIKELASVHHNVLVVGDDAQSIYSFRAADIGNILDFPKVFPKARIFKLQTNYRSTPDILELANQVIVNNIKQFPKELRAVKEKFIKPNLVPATSAAEEAEFISQQILQLRDEGVPLEKMAVLFRSAYHSQGLEFELNKRNIPYEFRGGVRFFERSHIKDVIAFLKVMNNPKDEVSWLRLLSKQIGIGQITAGRIWQAIKGFDCVIKCAQADLKEILTPKSEIGWQSLRKIFLQDLQINRLKELNDPAGLIRKIAGSDYQNQLQAEFPNWRERLDDLTQLAKFAESYQDVDSFLSEVVLQEGFGVDRGQADTTDDEKLILTTIHQAKGLEWQVVFVINLIDNGFPNQRALAEDGGLEEERRLFYVAVTRAQQQLFLTYPITGNYSSMYLNTPSQFLQEVAEDLFEEMKLVRGMALKDEKWLNNDSDQVQYLPEL